jgi:hypothetical protein
MRGQDRYRLAQHLPCYSAKPQQRKRLNVQGYVEPPTVARTHVENYVSVTDLLAVVAYTMSFLTALLAVK